jgi:hypothetical protein
MLLSGTPPFSGNSSKEICDAIMCGSFTFHKDFDGISMDAVDFITTCFQRENSRPSAEIALKHNWFLNKLPKIKVRISSEILENILGILIIF